MQVMELVYKGEGVVRRLVLAQGAAAGLLAAACGAGGQGGQPAVPAADLKGTTVEYLSMAQPTHPEEAARLKVLETFSQQNTLGIKVTTATSAGGQAGAREGQVSGASMAQVIAALAAGTPPDMVNTMNFNMAELFARGGTVDVDTELKGDAEWKKVRPAIFPHIVNGLSWRGKLFAVPTHSSFFLMYYNGELLKRAGLAVPPRTWTWNTFEEYARKVSQPPDVWAYDDGWAYARIGMMFINNGAKFTSPDGTKFLLTSPEVRETLEFQQRLVRANIMRPHDGSRTGGYKELLQEGKMAFQHAVPARVPVFRRDKLDFGTIFYPLGPKNTSRTNYSHGTTYGYTVFKNKDPKKQVAALHAALQAAKPESGLLFARDAGTPPSYRSVVESAAFQAEMKKDAESWPFYEVLPNFIPYPAFATFSEARAAVDEEFGKIWAGQSSLNAGLDEAQRRAQQLLDEALKSA
jgi:multiple sugar transport system substrate-binding protein